MSSRADTRIGTREVSAFTLVELLAAMAVLALLVLMLAQIFAGSQRLWKIGSRTVESNIAGRSVMGFMSRDLAEAVIGGSFTLAMWKDVDDPAGGDRIYFVGPNPDMDSGERAFQQVVYYISQAQDQVGSTIPGRYNLRRGIRVNETAADPLRSYVTKDWCTPKDNSPSAQWNLGSFNSEVVADNVWSFDVWYYNASNTVDVAKDSLDSGITYTASHEHGSPIFVDILLEILTDDDAEKVALLSEAGNTTAADDYAIAHAKRYTTRVHFRNRQGYQFGD